MAVVVSNQAHLNCPFNRNCSVWSPASGKQPVQGTLGLRVVTATGRETESTQHAVGQTAIDNPGASSARFWNMVLAVQAGNFALRA